MADSDLFLPHQDVGDGVGQTEIYLTAQRGHAAHDRRAVRYVCAGLATVLAISAQMAYMPLIRIVVCLVDYADTGSNPQDIVEIGSSLRGGRAGEAQMRNLEKCYG